MAVVEIASGYWGSRNISRGENLSCSLQVQPRPPTAPAQRVPRDKAATKGLSHASRLFDPTAWRILPWAVLDVSHPKATYDGIELVWWQWLASKLGREGRPRDWGGQISECDTYLGLAKETPVRLVHEVGLT